MLFRSEGAPAYRWTKMHNGQRFRVTCDDLRAPKNKEDSYLAANEWWRKKLIEIGPKIRKEQAPRPDQEDAYQEIKKRIRWAEGNRSELVPQLKNELQQMLNDENPAMVDSEHISRTLQLLSLCGFGIPQHLDPVTLEIILGRKDLWKER